MDRSPEADCQRRDAEMSSLEAVHFISRVGVSEAGFLPYERRSALARATFQVSTLSANADPYLIRVACLTMASPARPKAYSSVV